MNIPIIFPFALASEASTLDSEAWSEISERSLMWRSKPSAAITWLRRWKREAWIRRLSSRTYTSSHGMNLLDVYLSSHLDSRANHSVSPDIARVSKTLATSGQQSKMGLTLFDQPSASSRTSTASHQQSRRDTTAFSTMSSATWKKWVTEQRQDASARKKLGHPTSESGGSSLVWRTPQSQEPGITISRLEGGLGHRMYDKETGRLAQIGLAQQVNWPTPDVTMRPHEGNVRLLRRGVEAGMEKAEADAMLGRDISMAQGKLEEWTPPCGRWLNDPRFESHPMNAPSGGVPEPSNVSKTVESVPSKTLPTAWATPTAGDSDKTTPRSTMGRCLTREVRTGMSGRAGKDWAGHQDQENDSTNGNPLGLLNPSWVETLMGYEAMWTAGELTDLDPLATP